MRLWSLHPLYLDAKGLVALWREGLLAAQVLGGRTKGYTRHPQLDRFKASSDPVATIHTYLSFVCDEADRRKYHFDRGKLMPISQLPVLLVNTGQIRFEKEHLAAKLRQRDPSRLEKLQSTELPLPHPMMQLIHGGIDSWERI